MESTSAWPTIVGVLLGSIITLGSQLILYILTERGQRKGEHWRERLERLQKLRVDLGQLYHNVRLEDSYPKRLKEKALIFAEDFVYDLGQASDLALRYPALSNGVNDLIKELNQYREFAYEDALTEERRVSVQRSFHRL